jgi:hypothetical protein
MLKYFATDVAVIVRVEMNDRRNPVCFLIRVLCFDRKMWNDENMGLALAVD